MAVLNELTPLTKNLGLLKPRQNDFYNIEDHNTNSDIIDVEFGKTKDQIDKIFRGDEIICEKIVEGRTNFSGGITTIEFDVEITGKIDQIAVDGQICGVDIQHFKNENYEFIQLTKIKNGIHVFISIDCSQTTAGSSINDVGPYCLKFHFTGSFSDYAVQSIAELNSALDTTKSTLNSYISTNKIQKKLTTNYAIGTELAIAPSSNSRLALIIPTFGNINSFAYNVQILTVVPNSSKIKIQWLAKNDGTIVRSGNVDLEIILFPWE